jgi:hypothetical protein
MERIKAWTAGGDSRDSLIRDLFSVRPSLRVREHTEESKVRRCIKLVREDGQYRKGVQALTSFGTAPDNELTVDALRSLHPKGPPLPRHDLTGIDPFPIDSSDALRAIQSFPRGTGCGRGA